jgi:hypothetical protein
VAVARRSSLSFIASLITAEPGREGHKGHEDYEGFFENVIVIIGAIVRGRGSFSDQRLSFEELFPGSP